MKKPIALILPGLLVASFAHSAELSALNAFSEQRLTLDTPIEAATLLAQAAAAPTEEEKPARKPDIHYVPTPQNVVNEMLATAKVGKDEMVYDLGCGDGRIVITAAKKHGAKGTGIDIDPQRIREATQNAQAAGVQDRVKFVKGDIFESDFKDADVISLYLLTSINKKLRPKILAETRPGTRIVSHAFAMGEWEPDQEKTVEGSNIYYWVVPANVSGTWSVKGEGKPKVDSVTIEQSFQKISGTAQINGEPRKLGDGRVTGDQFTFTVQPANEGGQPITITGKVNGDQIEASSQGEQKATWTAQRDPATKKQIETQVAASE